MGLGEFVKGTIKVAGSVAKVTVELGADAVGAIAEKVNDDEESKVKYQNMGKKIGKEIKEKTFKFAESSEGVVDKAVDKGVGLCKDISNKVTSKGEKKGLDDDTVETYSYTVNSEPVSNEAEENVEEVQEVNEVVNEEINVDSDKKDDVEE